MDSTESKIAPPLPIGYAGMDIANEQFAQETHEHKGDDIEQ